MLRLNYAISAIFKQANNIEIIKCLTLQPLIRKKNKLVRYLPQYLNEWTINMNMKYNGFTLVEIMITLAVLGVLIAVGVPQFSSSTANSRLTSAINTLSGDLAFARTEAIKRGVDVDVKSSNADWAIGGWTISHTNLSGDTTKFRISPALTANATISTNPATTSVTFSANGRTTTQVAFSLCDNRNGNFGKKVTLNQTGQTYLVIKQACP